MTQFNTIAKNEFSKTFDNGEIKLYIAKAIDEETNKHYIVCSIPFIQEVDASEIKYPLVYDTEEERDNAFNIFEESEATQFVFELVNFIKEQKKQNETKSEQNN